MTHPVAVEPVAALLVFIGPVHANLVALVPLLNGTSFHFIQPGCCAYASGTLDEDSVGKKYEHILQLFICAVVFLVCQI